MCWSLALIIPMRSISGRQGTSLAMSTRLLSLWPIFSIVVARGEAFHPNFDDGAEVQKLLDAVEESAKSRSWTNTASTPASVSNG